MIKWTKKSNGTFNFDFTNFNIYVSLCLSIGISEQINCYGILSNGNNLIYYDETQKKEIQETLTPGNDKWNNYWTQFINALTINVKEKGWENKIYIAIYEKNVSDIKFVINLLKSTPLKILTAVNYIDIKDIFNNVNDLSINLATITDELYYYIDKRKNSSFNTTYYTISGDFPNTATKANPGEMAWIGWYAAKYNLNGFLKWTWDSWNDKPLQTTDFLKGESGECFLVYPNGRSSVRLERLIEGFQDYEKIKYILKNNNNWNFEIYKILKELQGNYKNKSINYANEVIKARTKLNDIVRRIIKGEKYNVENIAIKKTVIASSSQVSQGNTAEKGNDGDLNTRWSANTTTAKDWWMLDLGVLHNLNAIEIFWEQNIEYGYIIQISSDANKWKDIFDNTGKLQKQRILYLTLNEKSVRYIKIQMKSLPDNKTYAAFFEFRVYGSKI